MSNDLSESAIQKAVFSHLRQRAHADCVFWHCPNDKSSRRKAGYLEGVPDVHILHKGKFYAIELKRAKGGQVSEAQFEVIARINEADGYAYVAEGLDEAIRGLELWGILK